MLSYFIYRAHGAEAPVLWLVNIIIFTIFTVILWWLLQWVAKEFEVPAKFVRLLGVLIFLCLFLFLLVGCVGSGPGGRYTPSDAASIYNTASSLLRDYKTITALQHR